MIKYSLTFILLLFTAANSFSQVSDSLLYTGKYSIKVDSIKLVGNKITVPDVVMRELTFSPGDTVNPKTLEYNSNRVFSLGIFTVVNFIPYRMNNCNYVLIYVEESWYIYPIPFVDLQDKDWQKISYGVNLMLRNFRGQNETLKATAEFGYDPKFMIYYNRPYFVREQDIDLTVQLYYQNAINKSTIAKELYGGDFNQKFINGSIDFGKRLNLFNRIDLSVGYDYVDNPVYIKGVSASNGRIDRQISTGLSYTYDTRDLAQFPGRGAYGFANLQFSGLGIDNIDYQAFNIDLRKYFELDSGLRFKCRVASRMTFGRLVPYYDYSYFGYGERIRGYYNTEMEGNSYYIGSVELNYPIIKDVEIGFNFVPVIPKSLLTYRFAMYAELFTDSGVTRMWGQRININDLNTGYGAGLVFLVLPYSQLRIEYAFNNYGHSQFIFGLGTSF
ncbi:MAG: BamA/TamA family outer membrane protein [Ignavibacteriaceae bacterium]|nr:BamA/TamA family outer membrane protein [Ignavibacteriaceae bacterium]